ncbi:MAG TPA: MFS transporter [Kofleriaceae bacterium]|nr:MFS transporter [Kofleriaceae bacterium]
MTSRGTLQGEHGAATSRRSTRHLLLAALPLVPPVPDSDDAAPDPDPLSSPRAPTDEAAVVEASATPDTGPAPLPPAASALPPRRKPAALRVAGRIGRALRHRNYRLFFAGQGISVIGTWLTRFATSWMAYRLTGSALVLGLVAFFGQAPTSIIAPFAGVLVDRWDRHRTIVITQVAAMLQSGALAFFALTHTMTVYHLIALGAVQAVINAFDMPARQSFLGQMIDDRADLPNAIALNSSLVNSARLTGPVIAAVLVDLFGEGLCFAIDAASYLAVIASLLMMRVARRPVLPRGDKKVGAELIEGVRYVASLPLVRAVLMLLAVSSVLGGAYSALLPVVATTTLHGGPHTLGVLMGAAGCGALVGALYLASRSSILGLTTVIQRCATGLGAGLLALELAHSVAVAVPLMFVIGMAMIVQLAATNTLLQSIVDDKMLGRVISLYAVAFFGGAPLGALIEGSLASQIGAIHTFAIAGALCLASGTTFAIKLPALRAVSRPLYVRLGLLPE